MERQRMTHIERLPAADESRVAWSRYILGVLMAAILGLYAHWIIPDQIALVISVVAWAIVVFIVARLVIALISSLALAGFHLHIARQQVDWQRLLTEEQRLKNRQAEAEARRMEREANTIITIARPGDQVYLTELETNTTTRPLHLAPGQVNGRVWAVSGEESQRWAIYNLLHQPGVRRPDLAASFPALAPGAVDLLAALDNERRVLIVGPSNSGKTTLLHHIMQRQYSRSRVVIVDPHASPQKWAGHSHKVFGVGRNYLEIEWGLSELLKLMLKRYDDIGRGLAQEESHPPISILIDEWRAITDNLGSAAGVIKTLLTESRKAAFSVFLASHSERARPLGLAGEYDLKDGFAIVRLAIVNGRHTATLDTGSGEMPVILPGPFNSPLLPPLGAGGDDDTAALVANDFAGYEPEPTGTQRRILEAAARGATRAQICLDVWGYKSSKKYPEIDAVLKRFGVSCAEPDEVHRARDEEDA